METRSFGKTELTVSQIGLGGMPLSLKTRPPRSQAIAVIHRAIDLGVRLIDTADSYCQDESDKHHNEQLITEALNSYPGDSTQVVVATKGGLMRPEGAWTRNGNPEHLRQAIQKSFEILGGNKPIDLWQFHAPDPDYPLEESLVPVKEAVEQGLIRYIGVSNFSVEQIERARAVVDVVSVQNEYNLFRRKPEPDGVLNYCEQESLVFLPYRPLLGRTRVQKIQQVSILKEMATAKGVSVYGLVLAWLRSKSPCIVPIPGATQLTSIEDSVRSVDITLTPEEIQQMEQVTDQMLGTT